MTDQTESPEDVFAALMGSDVKPDPEPNLEPSPKEAATDDKPEGDDPPEPVKAEQQEGAPDPNQNLPDDVKQKLAKLAEYEENFPKLQRDYQAVYGRLAPMQRKIAEMEQAAKASSEAVSKPPQGQSAGTDDSLHDDLKRLEEDYPEIARALMAEREAQQKKLQSLEQSLQQVRSTFEPVARQVGHQTEVQRLTQAHADWQEINASEDFQGFVQWWWNNQPPAFRQAIGGEEGLRDAFNRADFTIPLLNQYKALRKPPEKAPESAGQAPRSQPNAQSAKRAMSAAPTVRSSGMPPAVDLSKLPEEEQFEMLWRQA